MPCTDGGVPYPPSESELLERKASAMLCAIWRAAPISVRSQLLAAANWEESGTSSREFGKWWRKHQLADSARQAAEAETKRQRALYESAKSKLTDAELTALRKAGLK